jgi:predicted extracellular nuclease
VGRVVPVLHRSDVDCGKFPFVKSGDLVSGIAGPLIYNFDQFKIVQQATEALSVTMVPTATIAAPPRVAAEQFSVATLNLENHFDAVDDTGTEAEPKPSPVEIAGKQRKLAHALSHVLNCPTIVGVQEVEKRSLLLDLAAEVAAGCGFTYDVSHLESVDSRGIDVALLSEPGRVSVKNAQLRQGCTEIDTGIEDVGTTCPAGESPLFSRPPLQVELAVAGRDYTFFVNHFKSKRGGEAATAPRRLAQAQHINRLVDALLASNSNARIVVLGDFNDYAQSPAMLTMTQGNGRLDNVLHQVPEDQRYSFVFGGVSQLIDGILLSPALLDDVVAVTILHVNADYPDSLANDVSPAHLAYKSTDHDLPLLVLALGKALTPETSPALPAEANEDSANWPLVLVGVLLLGTTAAIAIFRLYHKR